MKQLKMWKMLKTRTWLRAGACALAMGLGLGSAPRVEAARDAVGMVVSVKGAPRLGEGRLRLGVRVSPGDTILCAPGSEAVVVLFANGQRFLVTSGAPGRVSAAAVAGAKGLGAVGRTSAGAARALIGAKNGSTAARGRGSYGNFSMLAEPETAAGTVGASRPDLGFLVEGTRVLSLPTVPETQHVLFTLYDTNSDVVHAARVSGPQVQIPAGVTLQSRRAYVWSAVYFTSADPPGAAAPNPMRQQPFWGLVTWLSPEDARRVGTAVGAATMNSLLTSDASESTLATQLFAEYNILGAEWMILNDLRKRNVEGANDAFYSLLARPSMPQTARYFAGEAAKFEEWSAEQMS
jgi:hypothetical protein